MLNVMQCDSAQHGMNLNDHGTTRHDTARHGTTRHDTARYGTARHVMARQNTKRHTTSHRKFLGQLLDDALQVARQRFKRCGTGLEKVLAFP